MTLVTNPIFVIKTRMQTADANSPSRTVSGAVRELLRADGLRGFYRGLIPALPMTAHGAVHWAVFESMKKFVIQQPWHKDAPQLNYLETFATASGSKVLAAALTYPLHVLKTCLQSHRGSSPSLRTVVRDIYKLNGIRGFYAGFLPHLFRTVPNSTITMFFIEQFTQAATRLQSQEPESS
jgi:solute carrier family 25 (mitochondrial folate transporter), member 32